MYTVTVSQINREERTFEFSNKQDAIDSFIGRCDEIGYEYEIDEKGNYSTTTRGDYSIQLTETE